MANLELESRTSPETMEKLPAIITTQLSNCHLNKEGLNWFDYMVLRKIWVEATESQRKDVCKIIGVDPKIDILFPVELAELATRIAPGNNPQGPDYANWGIVKSIAEIIIGTFTNRKQTVADVTEWSSDVIVFSDDGHAKNLLKSLNYSGKLPVMISKPGVLTSNGEHYVGKGIETVILPKKWDCIPWDEVKKGRIYYDPLHNGRNKLPCHFGYYRQKGYRTLQTEGQLIGMIAIGRIGKDICILNPTKNAEKVGFVYCKKPYITNLERIRQLDEIIYEWIDDGPFIGRDNTIFYFDWIKEGLDKRCDGSIYQPDVVKGLGKYIGMVHTNGSANYMHVLNQLLLNGIDLEKFIDAARILAERFSNGGPYQRTSDFDSDKEFNASPHLAYIGDIVKADKIGTVEALKELLNREYPISAQRKLIIQQH